MKIAILGSRGIPAKYGGFETFADGLAENLVEKGYEVTVSCEYEPSESRKDTYKGAELVHFPFKPPVSYFLRKFYENLSDIYFLIKLSRSYDLIYFLGIEVGMFLFIPKILNRNAKVMVNVDGVMWKRTKFNLLERWLLKINHDLAIIFSDKVIVDSKAMTKYVQDRYMDKTHYISYGIDPIPKALWDNGYPDQLKKLTSGDINPGEYFLIVARLEPENNIHTIVEAFSKANVDLPLLIVGDFTSKQYEKEVKSLVENNSNVFFLGSIYCQNFLNMLRQNCTAYIHGHSVGGTNPSLLEATISRNIIIAHDNEFNREVCGKYAFYFENVPELTNKFGLISENPEKYHNLKEDVYMRVLNNYSWTKITKDYVSLLNQMYPKDKQLKKTLDVNYEILETNYGR